MELVGFRSLYYAAHCKLLILNKICTGFNSSNQNDIFTKNQVIALRYLMQVNLIQNYDKRRNTAFLRH